ncbi:hypothetical protein YC2023_089939 [Brassica napus]
MDPELEPPLVHFAATEHDSVDTAVSTNPGGGGKLQRCEEKALMISIFFLKPQPSASTNSRNRNATATQPQPLRLNQSDPMSFAILLLRGDWFFRYHPQTQLFAVGSGCWRFATITQIASNRSESHKFKSWLQLAFAVAGGCGKDLFTVIHSKQKEVGPISIVARASLCNTAVDSDHHTYHDILSHSPRRLSCAEYDVEDEAWSS